MGLAAASASGALSERLVGAAAGSGRRVLTSHATSAAVTSTPLVRCWNALDLIAASVGGALDGHLACARSAGVRRYNQLFMRRPEPAAVS